MFRNKDTSHFINADPEEKGFKVSTPVRFCHAFRGRMAIIKEKIKKINIIQAGYLSSSLSRHIFYIFSALSPRKAHYPHYHTDRFSTYS